MLFFSGQHLNLYEQTEAAHIFGEPDLFDFAPAVNDDRSCVHRYELEASRRFGGISTWHTDTT